MKYIKIDIDTNYGIYKPGRIYLPSHHTFNSNKSFKPLKNCQP